MSLIVSRLVVDFGLVILIWMVQLIVYPSFLFYTNEQLVKWHKIYTQKITLIVAPLMFLQTGLIAYQTISNFNWLNLSSSIICICLWAFTFFEAVPLHHNLEKVEKLEISRTKLVQVNKKRTALWTILFIISFFQFLNV